MTAPTIDTSGAPATARAAAPGHRPRTGLRRRGPSRFGGRRGPERRFVLGSMSPLVAYMAVFSVLPLLWAFALGFFDYSARRDGASLGGLGGDNPFVGLDNFTAMFDLSADRPLEVRQFHLSLKTTLLFAFVVVPFNLAITLPLASLIESVHRRARPLFRNLFFLPVLTSAVGVAIMWGFILHPQRGLLNGLITAVTGHDTVIAWTSDPSLSFLGMPVALLTVIVAYVWQDLGYNLVIFIAALQAVPQSTKEAALMDGARPWQMFRHVTVPLLRPTILLASILTMISAFQVFDLFQVMTRGGPNDQTRAMSLDIYESAFRFQRMGWSAAVSVVLFLIVLALSLVQSRLLRSDWEY